eukprot:6123122-Pyramimonas_sp.AAC.1
MPPRGAAADGWDIHFSLPAVRGYPSAEVNVVAQALTEEALDAQPAWKELQENNLNPRGQDFARRRS